MTVGFQNGSYMNGGVTASAFTNSGTITAADLYDTDYLDNKYDYNDTKEGYEIEYAGRDAALDSKISNICTYLENGREDKALSAYQELLAEISSQERYAQISQNDSQLKAIAKQLIESHLDEGQTLEEYIRANTANSFERGFEINWDGDKYQEEDLLKEICDLDETTSTDGLKKAGGAACKVLGVVGAVAAGILCPGPGWVGLAVGAVGVLANIFRK